MAAARALHEARRDRERLVDSLVEAKGHAVVHHPAVVVEAVTLLTPVAEGRGGLAERTRPHHPWRPHDHTTTSRQSMSTTSSSRSGRGGRSAHTSGGGAGWARRTHTTTSSLSTTRPHHVNLCPLHHPAVVVEAVTLLTPVAEGWGGLAERTRPHHPCRPHDHITSIYVHYIIQP